LKLSIFAQNNLGLLNANGQGVTQDYQEAVKWYRMAAEQGNALAQYNLGLLTFNGKGATQDYEEAARLYRLAAEQGLASAQYALGWMYANGQGVEQDHVRAHMRFNLAENKGNSNAQKWRVSISRGMTPAQIEQAQQMARECEERNYKYCD